MNEAIKLAIEKGGYKPDIEKLGRVSYCKDGIVWQKGYSDFETIHHSTITLDPLFWTALGKALGWGKLFHRDGEECALKSDPVDFTYKEWQWHAHQYFDIKLTQGNEDEFWKGILNDVR